MTSKREKEARARKKAKLARQKPVHDYATKRHSKDKQRQPALIDGFLLHMKLAVARKTRQKISLSLDEKFEYSTRLWNKLDVRTQNRFIEASKRIWLFDPYRREVSGSSRYRLQHENIANLDDVGYREAVNKELDDVVNDCDNSDAIGQSQSTSSGALENEFEGLSSSANLH